MHYCCLRNTLFLISLIGITSRDAEISELVRVLGSSHNTQIITELLLLQVALAQVLQLTLGETELRRGRHSQLSSVSGDRHIVGCQSTSLLSNLDAVVQVFLERRNIEDFIVNWLCAVNDELHGRFLSLNLSMRAEIYVRRLVN